MNKILLSIASMSAVLLFVGAGCSDAQTLENAKEIQENNNPQQEQIEKTEVKEEAKLDDTSTSTREAKTEVKNEDNQKTSEVITQNPLVKQNSKGSENEEENENENEREDEDEGRPTSVTPSPTATAAPTAKPVTTAPTTPPANTVKTISMAEVKLANNQNKCWSVISGKVYDLTPFTPNHPGGDAAILGLCGKDGTSAFMGQHGGQSRPETTLAKYFLGILK